MIRKPNAVHIEVQFEFGIPSSFPKWKKGACELITVEKITKPDLTDNLMKGLIDALTGICWEDDSQITRVHSHKYYSMTPQIILIIKEKKEFTKEDYKRQLEIIQGGLGT